MTPVRIKHAGVGRRERPQNGRMPGLSAGGAKQRVERCAVKQMSIELRTMCRSRWCQKKLGLCRGSRQSHATRDVTVAIALLICRAGHIGVPGRCVACEHLGLLGTGMVQVHGRHLPARTVCGQAWRDAAGHAGHRRYTWRAANRQRRPTAQRLQQQQQNNQGGTQVLHGNKYIPGTGSRGNCITAASCPASSPAFLTLTKPVISRAWARMTFTISGSAEVSVTATPLGRMSSLR